jgi:hypothetical protein
MGLAAVKGAIQVRGSILPTSSQGLTEAGGCAFERTAIMEEDPCGCYPNLNLWTARDAELSVGLGGSCRWRNVLPIVVAFIPGP